MTLAAVYPAPTYVHGDGYYTYLWARTLVFDGDMDFHDDYRLCPDPWGLARTPIGDDLNYWNLGPALFWVPILAADRLLHPATASPDPYVANACLSPLSDRAVFGSMAAGVLTVLLGFLIARRYYGDRVALVGALGIGLLTGLAYYATMLMSYGHAASSFGCGLLLYAWDRNRQRWSVRGWVAMGAALGLAMLMRSQNALLVIPPFVTWLQQTTWVGERRGPRSLVVHVGAGVLFTLAMLAVFFPQLLFLKLSTGSWFTVSQGEHYMRWLSSMPHKALFSNNGLVPWAPVHVPALIGLAFLAARRATRALGVACVALVLIDSWVVGAVYDWWGSVGYPGRRFDMLAVPFMLGLAAFTAEVVRWARRGRGRMGAALAWAALLPMAFWSLSVHVGVARGLRTDVLQVSPTQWRDTFGQVLDPVWRAVGNPLTWPASVPFALRYGTHPRRWDVVGGHELYYHDHQTLRRRPEEAYVDLADPIHGQLVEGHVDDTRTSVAARRGITFHAGTSRIFLPLHWPDVGAFEVRASPLFSDTRRVRIALNVNGWPLGVRTLAEGEQPLHFDVPIGATRHGINEVWVWVGGGSAVVRRLTVLDPEPPPEDEQRERNREVREERLERLGRR